jgi:hypothetical protein
MKIGNSGWLKRTWPLALSVLATGGIVRVQPQMYLDFEFSRHGKPVPAWYTDLNQDNDVFRYAYLVDGVSYEGKASWNDANSNIYSHKPGDELKGVEYCSTKPWLSNYRRDPKWELLKAKIWMGCNACFFLFGVVLYRFRLRRRTQVDASAA